MTATAPEGLCLVQAIAADVPELVSLINVAYDAVEFGSSGTAFKTTQRLLPCDVPAFAADVAAGKLLLAREGGPDGRIIGAIHSAVSDGHAHFGPLAVSVDAQGRGVGRALIAAAEAAAAAAGAAEMRIEVVDCRTDALPAYERAGYARTGTAPFPAPDRCSRPVHFILMAKPLRRPAAAPEAGGAPLPVA